MYQLDLVNDSNEAWMRGISVHIIGGSYDPVVYNSSHYVSSQSPTHSAGPIQRAIDDWESGKDIDGNAIDHSRGGLIMIYPIDSASPLTNPGGAHMENLIMSL